MILVNFRSGQIDIIIALEGMVIHTNIFFLFLFLYIHTNIIISLEGMVVHQIPSTLAIELQSNKL